MKILPDTAGIKTVTYGGQTIGWLKHPDLPGKVPQEVVARLHEGAKQEDNWSSYDCYDEYDIFYLAVPQELKDTNSVQQLGVFITKEEVLVVYTHWDDSRNDFIPEALTKKTFEKMTAQRAFLSVIDRLTKDDGVFLVKIEDALTTLEEEAMSSKVKELKGKNSKISAFRRQIQPIHQMYEQLMDALEDLIDDENGLYSDADIKYAKRIYNRTERLYKTVINLRDYISQVREAYQTQIDIGLNDIMKVFTVITAVLLPLTLMTSWYGMNFETMPEISWEYGYRTFIGAFVAVAVGCVSFFKLKKWF